MTISQLLTYLEIQFPQNRPAPGPGLASIFAWVLPDHPSMLLSNHHPCFLVVYACFRRWQKNASMDPNQRKPQSFVMMMMIPPFYYCHYYYPSWVAKRHPIQCEHLWHWLGTVLPMNIPTKCQRWRHIHTAYYPSATFGSDSQLHLPRQHLSHPSKWLAHGPCWYYCLLMKNIAFQQPQYPWTSRGHIKRRTCHHALVKCVDTRLNLGPGWHPSRQWPACSWWVLLLKHLLLLARIIALQLATRGAAGPHGGCGMMSWLVRQSLLKKWIRVDLIAQLRIDSW